MGVPSHPTTVWDVGRGECGMEFGCVFLWDSVPVRACVCVCVLFQKAWRCSLYIAKCGQVFDDMPAKLFSRGFLSGLLSAPPPHTHSLHYFTQGCSVPSLFTPSSPPFSSSSSSTWHYFSCCPLSVLVTSWQRLSTCSMLLSPAPRCSPPCCHQTFLRLTLPCLPLLSSVPLCSHILPVFVSLVSPFFYPLYSPPFGCLIIPSLVFPPSLTSPVVIYFLCLSALASFFSSPLFHSLFLPPYLPTLLHLSLLLST